VKSFKDSEGREWIVRVNIGTIRAVKDSLAIDLLAPQEPIGEKTEPKPGRKNLLVSVLAADASLLISVICVLLCKQLAERNIDEMALCESLGGTAAYDAAQAFWSEWQDFFQESHRPDAALMIRKHLEMIEAEAARDVAMVEKVQATVEKEMDRRRQAIGERLDAVGNGTMSMDSLATSE
jgi:hypothetical protein